MIEVAAVNRIALLKNLCRAGVHLDYDFRTACFQMDVESRYAVGLNLDSSRRIGSESLGRYFQGTDAQVDSVESINPRLVRRSSARLIG